jgi:hypothetical protein
MDSEQFWQILENCKDSDTPEAIAARELEKLSPEEIVSYQEHFDQFFARAYRWNLWGAAYLINGGCSDDDFIDFRYGLIAKGKAVYKKALENPDSLADLATDETSNEAFGYVAAEVYEAKTNSELPRSQVEVFPEPLGEEWDFDDDAECEKRLPKIWAKFVQYSSEEE